MAAGGREQVRETPRSCCFRHGTPYNRQGGNTMVRMTSIWVAALVLATWMLALAQDPLVKKAPKVPLNKIRVKADIIT